MRILCRAVYRVLVVSFVGLLDAAGGAAADSSPYPLTNGGFEGSFQPALECANVTGSIAPGWADNTCWDSEKPVIRYAPDSAGARSGATSQRITLVSGRRVQFVQYLGQPLESGRRYSASLWMRASSTQFVTLSLRKIGAPYTTYNSTLARLATGWTQLTISGVVDVADIGLFVVATAPGTFWIDDSAMSSTVYANATVAPPAGTITRNFFGMHFNRHDTAWPAVNGSIGAIRMWDAGPSADGTGTGAQWFEIAAAAGGYDWSGLDTRVDAALARGADVLYTLGGRTPQWASAQPNTPSPYGPGQCAPPKSNAIWQAWVRAAAMRYKGRIRLWEV